MSDYLNSEQFGAFKPEAKIWPLGNQDPEHQPRRVTFGSGPGYIKVDRSREMNAALGGTRSFKADDRPDLYTNAN